jgi:uncharacterized protein (TIGR03437 family)
LRATFKIEKLIHVMRHVRFIRCELYITLFSIAVGLLCHSVQLRPMQSRAADVTRTSPQLAHLGRIPLYFEENRGQGPEGARFIMRSNGFSAAFTPTEVLIQTTGSHRASEYQPCKSLRCIGNRPGSEATESSSKLTLTDTESKELRIGWNGNGVGRSVRGDKRLDSRFNYLSGNKPEGWRQNVPAYEKVFYPQIRPGIDLVFYGRQHEMEFDLVVAPGADPEGLVMTLDGADEVSLTPAGELQITMSGETITWKRPLVYQEKSTPGGDIRQRVEIAGNYRLDHNRVHFEVGEYDRNRTLVIDPILQYSSYIGGNSSDQIQGIATDAQGNIYVAGSTNSANFPVLAALRGTKSSGADMFISKLDPSGTRLIYSTFLGGTGDEGVQRLALAADGTVTVAGYTTSSNFPTANPAQAAYGGGVDAVVARLSGDGSSLIYSSYLGGSGEDAALAVALDTTGAAYATGYTASANFPTVNAFRNSGSGASEAFVTRFTPTGVISYSTYLGGNAGDIALGVAADSTGSIFVAGTTTSTNFPIANAFQSTFAGGQCSDAGNVFPCGDVFVTRINPTGASLSYSTYFGGTGDDQANALAIDGSNAAYITGYTTSANFPLRTPLQPAAAGLSDAFVAKIVPAGNALAYSTYLGGVVAETGTAIAVDNSGTAYVAGSTESNNFPLVNSLQGHAGVDAFVSRMNPAGTAMSFSTLLGGSDFDQALAITADNNGSAFVAGWTNSNDFLVRTPLQSASGGGVCGAAPLQYICEDGFIARITHQPGFFVGGMVNGASFAPGAPIAAGSIASAFGADLAPGSTLASTLPLPTTLGGVAVTMNNVAAPLFFVGGSQVNLQVPWELAGQSSATIVASIGGVAVSQTTVALGPTRPGIFTTNAQGTGQGAILIAGTADLVAPTGAIPGRSSRPASRGEIITIFCTGLGPVSNRPPSGQPGPSTPPLALTATTPLVSIGGQAATVSFSGLAPGFVGLYQVNASVPTTLQPGSAVPVVITMGGVASNTATIAVQ